MKKPHFKIISALIVGFVIGVATTYVINKMKTESHNKKPHVHSVVSEISVFRKFPEGIVADTTFRIKNNQKIFAIEGVDVLVFFKDSIFK